MLTGSITDVHKHMDTMYKRFVNYTAWKWRLEKKNQDQRVAYAL